MDIVTAAFFDHFTNPRNAGLLDNGNGLGRWGDPDCGDFLVVSVRIENGVIEDIGFMCRGCSAAIATSSVMTELARGRTVEEAARITGDMIEEALGGLPEDKRHCSLLGERALKAALENVEE
jgi:nitrogen fixation NifU-like protein